MGCNLCNVVCFQKLQSLWWSNQLGESNVHQEATGGKLTILGSHNIGSIQGPSSAILWVMLKQSCAMVDHVEAICQMLFGYVVGFVFQNPRSTKILSGFGELCWIHIGGKCKDWSKHGHFGPQIGAKCGHLRCEGIWKLQFCKSGHVISCWSYMSLRRFWGCVEGYMGSFWTILLRHSQKQPKDTPPEWNQNRKEPQKLRQNANLHGSKGKT